MSRLLAVIVFLFSLADIGAAYAAATLEAAVGDVRAGTTAVQASAAATSQRLATGSVVTTGTGSRATLRFDDGQVVALHENSEFRISDYAFSRDDPAQDRSRFELLKGAMRAVTGIIGRRSPASQTVGTTTATIGIRGTDFMLALVNPLFFRVLDGVISVVNSAGTATFSAGATGTVATEATLAVSIAPGALPPQVAETFNQLGALNLASLAEPPAAPGTIPPGIAPLIIPGAILIGIGAALSGGNDDNPISSGSTGSTGSTSLPGTSGSTGSR